jgi:hypothetical protein
MEDPYMWEGEKKGLLNYWSPMILFVIMKCTTIFKKISWMSGGSGYNLFDLHW